MTVFIRTNPYALHERQYQRAGSIKLDTATQDTRILLAIVNNLLKTMFKPGFAYHKCGVQLSHIEPESTQKQMELFKFPCTGLPADNRQLMKTIDQINRRFPKAISLAATGISKPWRPKAERISQRYTTDWRQLVTVKC